MADRLCLAVEAVGGDPTRVMAGTDCGFDTSAGLQPSGRGHSMAQAKSHARRRGPGQPMIHPARNQEGILA